MRRLTIIPFLLLFPLGALLAASPGVAGQADALHDRGSFQEAKKLLLDSVAQAADGKEKAELYWRAARETLELGDLAEDAGQPKDAILKLFEEGEGYAVKAIEADPQNDLAYYWKSSNIGRWGQVKGILNSLFKAGPMKDLLVKVLSLNTQRSDAYYVLGQLYRELPGWPLSFGNVDAAVSLGRKAIDLRMAQFKAGSEKDLIWNAYSELAKTLYKRNWAPAARAKEQAAKKAKYGDARQGLDEGSLYEAAVTLPNVSDREEAKSLAQWVVSELEKIPSGSRTAGQEKDLKKAKDLLKAW